MKMTNEEMLDAFYQELAQWMEGNYQNGNIEFAFRNGFSLHAVSLWLSGGASALSYDVHIDHREEFTEIQQMQKYADIYICPRCNHYSYFSPGQIEEDHTECESCLKTMNLKSRGK